MSRLWIWNRNQVTADRPRLCWRRFRFYTVLNGGKLRVLYCKQFSDKEVWWSGEMLIGYFAGKWGYICIIGLYMLHYLTK